MLIKYFVIVQRYVGESPEGFYSPYAGAVYPIGNPGNTKLLEFTPVLEDVLRNISDKDAVRLLETLEKYKKAAMFIVESLEQTLDHNMADQVGNTGKIR